MCREGERPREPWSGRLFAMRMFAGCWNSSDTRSRIAAAMFHADPRARVTALCDLFDDRIESGMRKIKVEKPAVFKDFEKLLAA